MDAGAEVTVMSDTMFYTIPEQKRPILREAKRNLVVAEAGKKMPIYVAPIGDELLLGCDIIDEKDITINTWRGLEIQGKWLNCAVHRRSDKIARGLLKYNTCIPPNAEVILLGFSYNSEVFDTRYASIEPVVEDGRHIFVARCLVDPYKDIVPVRLVNLENFSIKLKKKYLLSERHPVQNFEKFVDEELSFKNSSQSNLIDTGYNDIRQGVRQGIHLEPPIIPDDWDWDKIMQIVNNGSYNCNEKVDISKLPDHVVDLHKRCCEKLSDAKHKLKLAEVLLKYQDSFAKNKELGTCSLIQLSIETADAVPIRQPLRRTPQGFEGEEEKYLQEQIENGVVTQSTSAWASPVVLNHKKDGSVRWCIDNSSNYFYLIVLE